MTGKEHNSLVIGTYLRTASGLAGNVIAAIQLPTGDEYIATFRRANLNAETDESRAYSTHRIWFAEGAWMACWGNYDMSREAALTDMLRRSVEQPVMWAVSGTVAHDGSSRSFPTFYLNADVQGIVDKDHANRVAEDIVDAFGAYEANVSVERM